MSPNYGNRLFLSLYSIQYTFSPCKIRSNAVKQEEEYRYDRHAYQKDFFRDIFPTGCSSTKHQTYTVPQHSFGVLLTYIPLKV
jgi:hypothetical protein